VAVLEALERLRADFAGLRAMALREQQAVEEAVGPSWISYGEEPWLVGFVPGERGAATRMAIARPARLLGPGGGLDLGAYGTSSGDTESGVMSSGDTEGEPRSPAWSAVTLMPAGETEGESLGPALNGLRGGFPPGYPSAGEAGGVEVWFFRLLLPIILLLTGFTAYFAWRDVRRETEAVRLRSQFVSSVTHELKTPLTSIRMFAETLRLGRHSGPGAQQEYLDTVVHETERLSRLINNVLDFARIERGEKSYHMAPTDVGAAVQEAVRAVAHPLSQGGYTLNLDIAEGLPWAEADSDALTQAVLNLLSNAIKFSGEESEIDLNASSQGGYIHIQVRDQGRGIAPEDQAAIFDDFFRTVEAEKDGIPGTGLGLSLVAHVADAHGGNVGVESEVGRGSTFTIRIPVDGRPSDEEGAS
ncbi:MAG: HAMP domain-containing histidine kinase, partial [Gemmatimonadetes bacterium]|nr:HAMP domain-containing histidine kinase [Gemmatimonadota bacterium]